MLDVVRLLIDAPVQLLKVARSRLQEHLVDEVDLSAGVVSLCEELPLDGGGVDEHDLAHAGHAATEGRPGGHGGRPVILHSLAVTTRTVHDHSGLSGTLRMVYGLSLQFPVNYYNFMVFNFTGGLRLNLWVRRHPGGTLNLRS